MLLLALTLACRTPATAPAGAPNVLLITLDTTRADHLGLYGYFRDTTPTLDALAREAVVFDRCLAPIAVTLPSHTSMLTGIYPFEHGILANNSAGQRQWVRAPLVTLAEWLGPQGYRTGGFVSGAPLRKGSGIEEGFSVWTEPPVGKPMRRGAEATDDLLGFVDDRSPAPFFAWLHLFDAHGARPQPTDDVFATEPRLQAWTAERQFAPTLPRDDRQVSVHELLNAYDTEIRTMDAQIARIVAAGRRDGWWRNTVVWVVGDHGESIGQHGLSAHGYVWDEQLRVPCLVTGPGLTPRRVGETVSVVDLVPTLLGQLPRKSHFSAWPGLLSGVDMLAAPLAERTFLAQSSAQARQHGRALALTQGRWRYHHDTDGTERLFDLAADPHELSDLAAARSDVVEGMRRETDDLERLQRARGQSLGAGNTAPLAAEQMEELRALGYVE